MKKLNIKLNIKVSKKGKIAASAIALTAMIAVAGVTMALLNKKTEAAVNEFEGAVVNVGVLENGILYEDRGTGDSNINDSYTKVVSGVETSKTVAIKNMNSEDYPTTDTYVRVRLVPCLRYNESTEYAGQVVPVNMANAVTYSYGDTQKWMCKDVDGDKYYYYTESIAPDENTSDLITGVTYNGDVPSDTHFELQVLTEGIASRQAGSLQAWGFTDGQFSGLVSLAQ